MDSADAEAQLTLHRFHSRLLAIVAAEGGPVRAAVDTKIAQAHDEPSQMGVDPQVIFQTQVEPRIEAFEL